MWIILTILFSASVQALAPYEQLSNVKILRVLPGNVVLLNRGLEDGVLRNDHAKIGNETVGYAGRAICMRAQAQTSYWRVYRIPHAEAFSQDMTYTVSGMADREIPFPEASLRDREDFVPPPKKRKPGTDPFAVKGDLPGKLTERDLIDTFEPDPQRLFVERAFNEEQLYRDLQQYHFSVYASPFMRQSINEGETYRYGFRGSNLATRYRLLTQFEQQHTQLRDPFTQNRVQTRNTTCQAQFIIHRLSRNFSSLSILNYNSQRFSRIGTPQNHWQFGPLGFTWHLHESKTWEHLDLSYVPMYDLRQTQYFTGTGATATTEVRGIRHGFRLASKRRVNERVAVENLLWVRPFQDPASWRVRTADLNLINDLKLVFSLTETLFFDYNFIYQHDRLWRTLSGLPEQNFINSLNIRYDFGI
jgi:hypothetical protein